MIILKRSLGLQLENYITSFCLLKDLSAWHKDHLFCMKKIAICTISIPLRGWISWKPMFQWLALCHPLVVSMVFLKILVVGTSVSEPTLVSWIEIFHRISVVRRSQGCLTMQFNAIAAGHVRTVKTTWQPVSFKVTWKNDALWKAARKSSRSVCTYWTKDNLEVVCLQRHAG